MAPQSEVGISDTIGCPTSNNQLEVEYCSPQGTCGNTSMSKSKVD